ncbi:MAG: YbhN family protein [Chloroflexota bacterium]
MAKESLMVSPEPELGEAESPPEPLSRRFLNKRTFLSFLIGFGILALVMSRINVEAGAILNRLSQADLRWFALAFAVYYITFPLRALRWRKLLQNAGFEKDHGIRLPSLLGISEIIMLSWFANCIVPAKLGDAYRAYLLKRASLASFAMTFGTILAERIIDTLLVFLLLGGAALRVFSGHLPNTVMTILQAGSVLAILVVAGLVVMRNFSGFIVRLVPARFQQHYGSFEQGTLGSFRSLPMVLVYSLGAWSVEGARLYLVGLSLGVEWVSFSMIIFIAMASALLTTLPITPAGLGFVESAMVGILLVAGRMGIIPGMDESLATSVAILDRAISYWSLVLIGLVLYLVRRRKALI